MVFRPNEHMRFPTGERMLGCAAGGVCMFAANLPVVSCQCAWHGTMEKCCAGYQLEMRMLKRAVLKTALASRLSALVVKADYNLYAWHARNKMRISYI